VKSAREESVYINKISHSNVINNALCTLDNNALSNNKVHNALCCNDSIVNNDIIKCNWLTKDALWDKTKMGQIPKTVMIQNLAVKSRNIHVQKLSRYIFPKFDKGPSLAGQVANSPAQCLEYAVNLCMHRLPADLKDQWDELSGRDNAHPEISKLGIQSTKYDLRMRSDWYKREKNKGEYIQNLRNVNKNLKGQKSTECEGTDSLLGSSQDYGTGQGHTLGNVKPLRATENLAAP
jgi:hypothetical protein